MAKLKAEDQWSTDWVREQIAILRQKGFYHSIELPNGEVLEGVQSIAHLKGRLARFPIPQDLTGKRVLDIGAWDGWFSFEMERRGADVMAVDCIDMERFRLAHRLLGSSVEYRILDVDELTPETVGRFDIVLFFGVLYHLRHPLLSLERICQLTRDMALVESFVTDDGIADSSHPDRPVLEFYETDELLGQMDNWFGPNTSCMLAMCRSAGFARVELSEVAEQRGHVTCYRHWTPAGAGEPPVLNAAVNNRSNDNQFHKLKDEYVSCYFESKEPELSRASVMPEIDGYGLPVMGVASHGNYGWQADCRFPAGLDPGTHELRLRTLNSGYSNSVTIELHPPRVTRVWM